MSDELWTNERIRDRYHALVPCEANMGEMEYWNVLRDVGERVSYELRDEYQRELAALRTRVEELELERITLWHTINTQAEYAEGLEAEIAEQEEKFDHYTTETTGIVVALNAENEQLKAQLAEASPLLWDDEQVKHIIGVLLSGELQEELARTRNRLAAELWEHRRLSRQSQRDNDEIVRLTNALEAAPVRSDAPSPDHVAERMAAFAELDAEGRHMQGDALLCDTLRALGYGNAVDEFERWMKWYA